MYLPASTFQCSHYRMGSGVFTVELHLEEAPSQVVSPSPPPGSHGLKNLQPRESSLLVAPCPGSPSPLVARVLFSASNFEVRGKQTLHPSPTPAFRLAALVPNILSVLWQFELLILRSFFSSSSFLPPPPPPRSRVRHVWGRRVRARGKNRILTACFCPSWPNVRSWLCVPQGLLAP